MDQRHRNEFETWGKLKYDIMFVGDDWYNTEKWKDFEKQFEAFLGFPSYFYMDDQGNQIDASEGRLANSRRTNTIIFSMSKIINF